MKNKDLPIFNLMEWLSGNRMEVGVKTTELHLGLITAPGFSLLAYEMKVLIPAPCISKADGREQIG